VFSVDYALSPESPFPKPLDDCYSATRHVADRASDFGIDANNVAVVGDSAGGNLAAAVSLRARDEAGPKIKLQVLIYPVIEPDFESESYLEFAEDHGLSRATMQWFWEQYMGEQASGWLSVPSKADSHAGLPAAHVITAEYDVLRDEGEAYARRLSAAGVQITSKRYDGNLHGFVHFAGMFDDGMTATNDIAQILKSQLR
jgi:acetyl esterase